MPTQTLKLNGAASEHKDPWRGAFVFVTIPPIT